MTARTLVLCLATLLASLNAHAQRAPLKAAPVTVKVPDTAHVHVTVPAGLQHWLNEDDRMIPWLNKAVTTVDGCYAELRTSNPQAAGTIALSVVMHKNARPTGTVSTLPSALKSMVACVTTRLWSVRMPLFTGTEGQRFAVQVRLTP